MKMLHSLLLLGLSFGLAAAGAIVNSATEASATKDPPPFDLEKFLNKADEVKGKVEGHLKLLEDKLKDPNTDVIELLKEITEKGKENVGSEVKKLSEILAETIDELVKGLEEEKKPAVCGEFKDYVDKKLKNEEKPDPKELKIALELDLDCFWRHVEDALKDFGELKKDMNEEEKPSKEDVLEVVDDVLEKLMPLRGILQAMKKVVLKEEGGSPAPGSSGSSGGTKRSQSDQLFSLLEDLLEKRNFDNNQHSRMFDSLRQYRRNRQ